MSLDFNDAFQEIDVDRIKDELLQRIEDVLFYLFPAGIVIDKRFHIGNIKGQKGKSLIIELSGNKKGNWYDFATSEGGDIINLWQEVMGYSTKDFPKLLSEINEWLGLICKIPKKPLTVKKPPIDKLGKYTAKWDYLNQDNKLIAVVYRYDTDEGKEFRIWDVSRRKALAPQIRPLYNIPGIINSRKVIITEGEKSAEALIQKGFAATTAMCGANAPLEKTDWSPLKDKEVIIWPDNDECGIEYAGRLAEHLQNIGIIYILTPPDKAEKWDAYDAVKENFNISNFLKTAKALSFTIPSYSIDEFLSDNSPMPEDLISSRLLTPSGLLLIGGAPKVGKSDFLINLLIHMAAGEKFLGFKPPKPLKIFYLQAEIGYHYMRERIKKLKINKNTIAKAAKNLIITANIQMILNDKGIDTVYKTIKASFPNDKPDIICIDPIRNLFDGGNEKANENDNNAMLFFLQNRIERLRSMIDADMGVILCHHTKKIKKKELEEDPFQAFSGAGSLRSFYSSGLIMHRPDEFDSKINLYFELRNGSSIAKKIIEKEDGKWVELNPLAERLISAEYTQKLDAERSRKKDVILELLAEEALKGRLYTALQFAEKFESSTGLGGIKTIRDRISILATKGYIKFIKNNNQYGLKSEKTRYGLLCIEDMQFVTPDGGLINILPTHYKCSGTGAVLPVENNKVWITHDQEANYA